MLNEKMEAALNRHLNEELFSAYLYLSMSAYFDAQNLAGFANWMRIQGLEELSHAQRFYTYINERGGRVLLAALAAPETQWASPLAAFEAAYQHEVHISAGIHGLVDLAAELRDHPTANFLQWFVSEQVEEEASADEVVQRLRLIGNQGAGLFMMDREMASRVFVPAPAA